MNGPNSSVRRDLCQLNDPLDLDAKVFSLGTIETGLGLTLSSRIAL